MERLIPPSIIQPQRRHPRASKVLRGQRQLGPGESAAVHVLFATGADAVVSDDAAFIRFLRAIACPFLLPASVVVMLAQQRALDPSAGLAALDRMRTLIRDEVYRAARADVDRLIGAREETR